MAVTAGAVLALGVRSSDTAAMTGLTVVKPCSRGLRVLPNEVLDIPITFVSGISPGLDFVLSHSGKDDPAGCKGHAYQKDREQCSFHPNLRLANFFKSQQYRTNYFLLSSKITC
jgi:hypothetical protein